MGSRLSIHWGPEPTLAALLLRALTPRGMLELMLELGGLLHIQELCKLAVKLLVT